MDVAAYGGVEGQVAGGAWNDQRGMVRQRQYAGAGGRERDRKGG